MTYCSHKNSVFADVQKGFATLNLAIVFALALLSVFYLAQVNGMVAGNFELRSAQNALRTSQSANQEIAVLLMQAKSLSNLADTAKQLNLVAVESVDYLKIVPGLFALSQNP